MFTSTARHLTPLLSRADLHVPARSGALSPVPGLHLLPAWAPLRPAVLRHLCCALTIGLRRAFRAADIVYTRNLVLAGCALLFGQRVVFDHYRPWPEQIPPLRRAIFHLMCHRRMLLNICHSNYTRQAYLALGIPPEKLVRVLNGHEPQPALPPASQARAALGLPDRATILYSGRLNHRKGLALVVAAARLAPEIQFVLVGSHGAGPIEALAAPVPNIRIVPWQDQQALPDWIAAADLLIIPPSLAPLAEFGSTVLPLKLFLYMASGRPILAGDAPDVREVLTDGHDARLCPTDDPHALAQAARALIADRPLQAHLAANAAAAAASLSWAARAGRIHALIQQRLVASPPPPRAWQAAQRRAASADTARWWAHLRRTRSFVLPPDPARLRAAPPA